ncbi:ecto-ADP-ribosyltransferase 5-like [Brachyhypopomus gauderio]|uniref:ecto-ADP-ribosyltransferase 5-like n=1 Tax=Brachyhypopomus gauderio TaxID=698409 RepID=UPI004041D2A1
MAKSKRHLGVGLFLLVLPGVLSETVNEEVRHLDMSPNAVDDTFTKCQDTMMQTVTLDGLLQKEIKTNEMFAEMWRSYYGMCEKQIYWGTPYHLAALQNYGNSKEKNRDKFNQMVQTKGSNSTIYKNEFLFKSLHFLLTDAMRLLNNGTRCSCVYYSIDTFYTAQTRQEVRFGRFLEATTSESIATELIEGEGIGTLFNITSCSAVNIEDYVCRSEEIEQLISPTEVFTVQSIREVKNDDANYKIITLTHSRFLSSHDCYLFHRSSQDGLSSLFLSSVIIALTGSFLNVYCTVME